MSTFTLIRGGLALADWAAAIPVALCIVLVCRLGGEGKRVVRATGERLRAATATAVGPMVNAEGVKAG